jgi:multisubunit Na+/H+ antiporter MnhC subunit
MPLSNLLVAVLLIGLGIYLVLRKEWIGLKIIGLALTAVGCLLALFLLWFYTSLPGLK